MSYGIRIEVWGEYALFSRPEMKTERVSYDIITPSAARGILEAIYWHPGLSYVIDKIYVCKEIRFANIRRNEVKDKISANIVRSAIHSGSEDLFMATADMIQQRASMLLKNVRYVIEAHFILTDKANASDNEGKFCDIIKRRLQRGQFYHQPYFGCREFPANFKACEEGPVQTVYEGIEKDLGYMLYDMDYSDLQHIQPIFFRAVLKNGVLDIQNCEVHR